MRCVLEVDDFFHLQLYVGFDLIVGEDITLGQELTIGIEAVQRITQGCTDSRDVLQLFGWQIIEILVHGFARMDLVADTVKTGHQQG